MKEYGSVREKKANRLGYFDIAKGIGCIMVVMIHMPSIPLYLRDFFNVFATPLFFFISCYFVNRNESIIVSLKKNVINILLPYYVYCFIFLIFDYVGGYLNKSDILLEVENAFYGYGSWKILWFFFTLFWVRSVVKMLSYVDKYCYIVLGGLIVISYYASTHVITRFNVLSFFEAIIYGYTGFIISKKNIFEKLQKGKLIIASVGFILLSNIVFFILNNFLTASNYILVPISRLSLGMLGIFGIVFFSRIMDMTIVRRSLGYIGRNSLFFYPLMSFVPDYFVNVCSSHGLTHITMLKLIGKVLGVVLCVLIIFIKSEIMVKLDYKNRKE